MPTNRSIPRSTVLPELAYPDIGDAVDRLCKAFGFTLRIRMGNHRAQMNVGEGAVIFTEEGHHQSGTASILVRVEDVDAHHERAFQNGAHIIKPPTDYPYGERQYSAVDFAGHHWCFSQSIADVDPKDWGGTPDQL